jgi:cytochrome c oxidase subunit III
MEAAAHTAVHDEHHGPPAANVSSRVEAQFLGMLLFIISEIMLFGAFFTAYFFIRVVGEAEWFPVDLPVAIAAVNSAILLTSSVTMHWALEGARRENRNALRIGLLTTFLLGLTFLTVQVNEYIHLGIAPSDNAQATIFYGLTGLHGAHVFIGLTLLAFANIRAFRGHYSAKEHRGVEVPGIYWHFVDIMWIFVFSTLYVL